MSKPDHAPAPWTFHLNEDMAPIRDANGLNIASVVWPDNDQIRMQMMWNGDMLAAAPELYSACERALNPYAPTDEIMAQLRAALSKARGGR